ncbi:PD-(D/E)XK nuclease family protein [Haloarchaeobius sp. HRN-SO-5]|uniref:PD-(D/E)XK nuclease family protein n=1 Tax=Haloarchaeobius sp. HRN-SO-5 TaxID=3446118 RepID=UPI003EB9E3AB
MSDGVRRVSPSSLAVYAACPRQYQYDKVWDVASPEESRRYLDRGLAYHGAIEDTCAWAAGQDEPVTDSEIQEYARSAIEDRWVTETDRGEYASDAQYAYDRRLAVAAVAAYFREDGLEHARNSVEQEAWLTCDRGDVHLHGRVDNVVATDEGLQIIDYKGSLTGIVSGRTEGKIEEHHAGEAYHASILKSVFQAAAYIEGAKNTDHYRPGMDVEFTFYGVMQDRERIPERDGITVEVSGRGRDVGRIYDEHEDTIWELVADCYRGIVDAEHEPVPWDRIRENACGDCAYRGMCGDYLGEEVRLDD